MRIQGLPSFHFRILTFCLCCFLGETYLPTTYPGLCPSLSVCLSVLHTCTTELSPRPSSHNTASAPIFWSLTGVNEFPDKIPRSEGKAVAAQVPACRCVRTGQRWPGARVSGKALQLPDTREDSGGGGVRSTLSCGADEVCGLLVDVLFLLSSCSGSPFMNPFINTSLRRIKQIFGPYDLSDEQLKKTSSQSITKDITLRRLRWLGRVFRMKQHYFPRGASRWTPLGNKKKNLGDSRTPGVELWYRTFKRLMSWGEGQRFSEDHNRLRALIEALCPIEDEEEK